MIYKIICAGENDFKDLYSHQMEEVIIAVDGGYKVLSDLHIKVDYFFGDCDSLSEKYKQHLIMNVKNYNLYKSEKDQTDLELALSFVFSKYKNNDEIIIYNATGNRLDHYEGAIRLLKKYKDYNICIINKNNIIKVYNECSCIVFKKDDYKYISFFNIYPNTVLTLRGFKYPLENYLMDENDYLCISNQILDTGEVETNKSILVIKSN